jgi:hypothetical protein
VPDHLFVTFKLNGKVIPPGRVRLLDNSGTLQFDITDYCSTSESADTTNTLEMKIWNGVAKQANYYHQIEGTVKQISVTELLESQ